MVILKIVTAIMQMIMIIKWHNDNEYGHNNDNNDHDNNNDNVALPTIKSKTIKTSLNITSTKTIRNAIP